MTPLPSLRSWKALGIAPTTDIDLIGQAYRSRLREVDPNSDPEGFRILRKAHEAILAHASGATANHDAGEVRAFMTRLARLRAAGDTADAIAYAKQMIAAQMAGSPAFVAMEDALFHEVALQNQLSPDLFLFLATRFEWHDIQARVARGDPQRHAAVLTRIHAEKWLLDLRRAARNAGGRMAALIVAPHKGAQQMLAARPLDASERAQVRALFEQLLGYAGWLLIRFDGATLALLREAVEDAPLPVAVPAPAATSQRSVRLAIAVVMLALVAGLLWWKAHGRAPTGTATAMAVPSADASGPAPALPSNRQRAVAGGRS